MARPRSRERLIEGSRDALHRGGFHAASVEVITRSAGVAKGSFSNHCRSKDEWALEVLDRYWADARVAVDVAATSRLPTRSVRISLRSAMRPMTPASLPAV